MTETTITEKDFDLIAQLPYQQWDHNNHFFNFILREVRNPVRRSLEVGCGKGGLCNLLSSKSEEIIGIDLSNNMIESAKREFTKKNIDFVQGDYLKSTFRRNTFDLIVSIATVHHIDFDRFLIKSQSELKKGGKLIIIDLYQTNWKKEFFKSVLSQLLDYYYNIVYNGKIWKSSLEKKYWNEHGKHDNYMEFDKIIEIANSILGRPKIAKRLFWRYSLVWVKN